MSYRTNFSTINFSTWLLLISMSLFSVACSGPPGVGPKTAAKTGEAFFEAIKAGNFEKALDHYSDKFFEMRPRDKWMDNLKSIEKKAGAIQSYAINDLQSDTRFSGKFFIFTYRVIRSNGTTWETLTMRNPVDSTEVELIGHKIKVLSK